MLADTFGRPLRLLITPEQAGNIASTPGPLKGQPDKSYYSNDLRSHERGGGDPFDNVATPHDVGIYKHCNQIERCFSRLKRFCRFANRYDRRIIHSTGFVHLSAIMVWLR